MRADVMRVMLAWIREHGVEAWEVSGTVHIWSWCTVRDGEAFRVLDVVSTFYEARRVLGY